jgi:hypothetical protein
MNAYRIGGTSGSVAVADMVAGPGGGLILVGRYANKININPFAGAKKYLRTVEDKDDSDVLVMKLNMVTYV